MGLTLGAGSGFDFLVLRLIKRTEYVATLDTVILDHAELRKDAGRARYDSARAHQLVQVELPKKRVSRRFQTMQFCKEFWGFTVITNRRDLRSSISGKSEIRT